MPKTIYRVVVQKVIEEEQEMELEADSAMEAFDEARKMTIIRNQNSTSGTFSVIKVESKNHV